MNWVILLSLTPKKKKGIMKQYLDDNDMLIKLKLLVISRRDKEDELLMVIKVEIAGHKWWVGHQLGHLERT